MSEGRFELKYALPLARRMEMLECALAHVHPDPHASALGVALPGIALPSGEPASGYLVHSLYLDDPTLTGYARRLARDRIRNRMRIRTYGLPGDDAPVFLEAKRKLSRKVIKHRIRVGNAHAWAQGDPNEPWVDAVARLEGDARRAGERWVEVVNAEHLGPIASTHYVREVFIRGTERLSIDHRVSVHPSPDPRCFQHEGTLPLIPPDWLVVELKFNGDQPQWMRDLVRDLRLASEPISKFALGVARAHRADRPGELRNLTPPTILRTARQAR